jgi:hypothetical protein
MTDRTEAMREEIARIAAPMMEGGREFDQCPPDRIALRKWNRDGMCSINDATQDDALTLADALLPIITRERERAARAALEAAGDVAKTAWVSADYNTVGIADADACMQVCEHAETSILALSPADIVKGMK